MKKRLLYICFFVLICCIICSNSTNTNNTGNNGSFQINNSLRTVYDIDNNKIGEIDAYGAVKLVNHTIIYSQIPNAPVDKIRQMNYYFYDIDEKTSYKVGSVKNWSFDAFYESVKIDDHLYTLISTGNSHDINNRTISIYDFNLLNKTMRKIYTLKGGIHRNSMTLFNGNILLTDLKSDGNCCILEYDIKADNTTEILKSTFDSTNFKGEIILHIESDSTFLYLLKIKYSSQDDVSLILDSYDYKYKQVSSMDVSDIYQNTDGNNIIMELTQFTDDFRVKNNMIYYQNLSMTRFLGVLNDKTPESICNTNCEFASALNTNKNYPTWLFYKGYNSGDNPYSESNDLYLYNSIDKSIKKTTFYADDERYYFVNASQNDTGQALIVMSYKDSKTAEEFPTRIYYLNLSDLKFQQ